MLTKTSVAASVKSQNKLINHADDNLLALSSPFLANSQRFHDHVGVSLLQNISFIFAAADKIGIDFLFQFFCQQTSRIMPRRSNPGVISFRAKDIIQDLLLHLPGVGPGCSDDGQEENQNHAW